MALVADLALETLRGLRLDAAHQYGEHLTTLTANNCTLAIRGVPLRRCPQQLHLADLSSPLPSPTIPHETYDNVSSSALGVTVNGTRLAGNLSRGNLQEKWSVMCESEGGRHSAGVRPRPPTFRPVKPRKRFLPTTHRVLSIACRVHRQSPEYDPHWSWI